MEAKELRMGNLLLTDYDYLVEVEFIHRNRFDCRECTTGNFVLNGKYKPILLTEQWLLKFGFERVTPTENGYDNDCAYELKNFGRIALKNGFLITDQYYFLDGLDFNLKHVHELQNLYYALTKQELTIKK